MQDINKVNTQEYKQMQRARKRVRQRFMWFGYLHRSLCLLDKARST